MHIPDGYLSPSTCATFYAASTPFWYVALQRAKRSLSSRTLPLLSVFSAFSFVIMMFNLPLPGGTTGHAVGMAMASIILGPWIGMLAISTALLVQALLFGDGGITAFGANCFNMAIIGSLVSYAVYRAVAYRAPLQASRRVFAAGLAGYLAINAAALCAAIEFGLQPLLFHDASGTPLYAPYPLKIAVPAMLIGHLTFAGLAELVLSAGMIAYIQRTQPELLRQTAPHAHAGTALAPAFRRLWLALACFLVLTPLGILAGGSAWGEWRVHDFKDPGARSQIQIASLNHAPPGSAPRGLQQLSEIWSAPLANYAPTFIRSAGIGYLASAALGTGCIILLGLLAGRIISRFGAARLRRITFIEKTIRGLAHATEEALFAEEIAKRNGFLQRLDARVKMAGFGSLIVAAVAVRRIEVLAAVLLFAGLLAILSRVPLRLLLLRVWLVVLGFTGLIAIPAIFLTPGRVLLPGITAQGLETAALLTLRAECAATLVFLLLVTTSWIHILRSLRWFRVPAYFVALLEISYRYIFVLLQAAQSMFESRQTRLVGQLEPAEQRRFATSAAAVLLDKAFQLSGDVHTAMLARGFRGEIVLLEDLSMTRLHWLQAASLLTASCLFIWFGR